LAPSNDQPSPNASGQTVRDISFLPSAPSRIKLVSEVGGSPASEDGVSATRHLFVVTPEVVQGMGRWLVPEQHVRRRRKDDFERPAQGEESAECLATCRRKDCEGPALLPVSLGCLTGRMVARSRLSGGPNMEVRPESSVRGPFRSSWRVTAAEGDGTQRTELRHSTEIFKGRGRSEASFQIIPCQFLALCISDRPSSQAAAAAAPPHAARHRARPSSYRRCNVRRRRQARICLPAADETHARLCGPYFNCCAYG
jgi:hypothetical protein